MKTYILTKSNRKNSEYKIDMGSHSHHFGGKNAKTYVSNRTDREKDAWIARHKKDKNWDDFHSSIYMSKSLLWGPHKSLDKNIREYERIHDVKIIKRIFIIILIIIFI